MLLLEELNSKPLIKEDGTNHPIKTNSSHKQMLCEANTANMQESCFGKQSKVTAL